MSSTMVGARLSKPERPQNIFEMPKEHGATVAFFLSAFLALVQSGLSDEMLLTAVIMTAIMFSIHRIRQAAYIGLIGSALLAFGFSQYLMSGVVLAMAGGLIGFEHFDGSLNRGFKQTLGMFAVSCLPLLAAAMQSGFRVDTIVHLSAFIASAMVGTAVVQLQINSRRVTPAFSIIASVLGFLVVACFNMPLLILCLVPYAVQALWLGLHGKPSFKALGIAEALCLLWCTVAIAVS